MAFPAAGSIAFVGINVQGNDADRLAFVVIDPIAAGTTIYFSDNEWGGSSFNSGEAYFRWTAPASEVPAGTLIEIGPFASATLSTNLGTAAGVSVSGNTNYGFANGGETVYAYTAAPADPTAPQTFLAAISTDNLAGANLTNTGLAAGSTAIILTGGTPARTAAYNAADVDFATREEALSKINSTTNWVRQNTGDPQNDGTAPDAPFVGYTGSPQDPQSPFAGIPSFAVACYCRGTLILTESGERPVEELQIGDAVVTASGALRPIKWIGRRSYAGRFALGQKHILPIRIGASALGNDLPRRDLSVSPHHAMYLEGVLIEARDLVNGVSIVQAERIEKVEYFHIELETHDAIVAEGALSETFIDDDSRAMFHNANEYRELYPEDVGVAARYFAPRVSDGYEIERVRRAIAERAGIEAGATANPGSLRGQIDMVDGQRIAGWAQNMNHPEAPVCLDIFVAGKLAGRTLANRHRTDLKAIGLGSGRHGFEFTLPGRLAPDPDAIEVRRSMDGSALRMPRARVQSRSTGTAG